MSTALIGTEQRAVDNGLVLAGIVSYPAGSVQGAYYANLWSLFNQAAALLLATGAPQVAADFVLSLLIAIALIVGLGLVALALSKDEAIAIGTCLLVLFGAYYFNPLDYPMVFFRPHTYGAGGLALVVLCAGLIGNGRWFASGLVAGSAVAFHAVLGAWLLGLVAFVLGLLALARSPAVRPLSKGIAVGLAVAGASLIAWLVMRRPFEATGDPSLLAVFNEVWDYHRTRPYSEYASVNGITVALPLLVFLVPARREGMRPQHWLAVLLLAAVATSILLYEVFHRFREMLPRAVFDAMPSRLINLHYLLPVAVTVGCAATWRPRVVFLPLAALFVWYFDKLHYYTLRRAVLIGCILAVAFYFFRERTWMARLSPPRLDSWLLALFAAFLLALTFPGMKERLARNSLEMIGAQREDVRFIEQARRVANRGMVVASPGLGQFVLRRLEKPVLIDAMGLDFVPYIRGSEVQIADIVTQVYGIDFRNPPPEQERNRGALSPAIGRAYWAGLDVDAWRELGRRYCFDAIAAPATWPLKLQPAATSAEIKLYVVPVELPERCAISRITAATRAASG